MIPNNGSSFGIAGGPLRRYPGGTENTSIFATVRGSIPKRRAASRRLIPSTYTAHEPARIISTRFIPRPPLPLPGKWAICCRIFTPVQPVYPAASRRDFLSGAYTASWNMLRYLIWEDQIRRPSASGMCLSPDGSSIISGSTASAN